MARDTTRTSFISDADRIAAEKRQALIIQGKGMAHKYDPLGNNRKITKKGLPRDCDVSE